MAVEKDDAVNVPATSAENISTTNTSSPGMFSRIKRYLREVTAELKKTSWPTRDELTKSTIVVVLTIVMVAVFLFVCDTIVGRFMSSSFINIVQQQPK